MEIVVGSDHAGFDLKQKVIKHLQKTGHHVDDVGCHTADRVDYPDFGYEVANRVAAGAERGIVVCGSGIGISIAANRNPAVRAALCHSEETAKLAREHNDANVLAMGARIVDHELALKMVDTFLTTEFAGGRHAGRVAKLNSEI